MHFVFSEQVLPLKKWLPHFDTESFGFIGTGYGAAVVIGKNNYGFPPEFWIENAFAGSKKIVAIQKCKNLSNKCVGNDVGFSFDRSVWFCLCVLECSYEVGCCYCRL